MDQKTKTLTQGNISMFAISRTSSSSLFVFPLGDAEKMLIWGIVDLVGLTLMHQEESDG